MLLGTKSSLADVNSKSLEVAGTHVHVSDGSVRNLGVLLNNPTFHVFPGEQDGSISLLTFEKHWASSKQIRRKFH